VHSVKLWTQCHLLAFPWLLQTYVFNKWATNRCPLTAHNIVKQTRTFSLDVLLTFIDKDRVVGGHLGFNYEFWISLNCAACKSVNDSQFSRNVNLIHGSYCIVALIHINMEQCNSFRPLLVCQQSLSRKSSWWAHHASGRASKTNSMRLEQANSLASHPVLSLV